MKNDFNRGTFLKTTVLSSGGILAGLSFVPMLNTETILSQKNSESIQFSDLNAAIKISKNNLETVFHSHKSTKKTILLKNVKESDIDWQNVYNNFSVVNYKEYQNQLFKNENNPSTEKTLLEAAAKKWNTDVYSCSASNGIITNKTGEKLCYADLVKQVKYINKKLIFLV